MAGNQNEGDDVVDKIAFVYAEDVSALINVLKGILVPVEVPLLVILPHGLH